MSIDLRPEEGQEFELSSSGRLTIPWSAAGSSDRAEVEAAIASAITAGTIPGSITGRVLDRIQASEDGPDYWKIDVEYAAPGEADGQTSNQPPQPEIVPRTIATDFGISAETIHRTHSLQTISGQWIQGVTAIDFKGGINVDEDGIPQGVEVGPSMESATSFTIRQRYYTSFLNSSSGLALFDTIETLAGSVCSQTFANRPAGEVLFLGSSGSIEHDNETSDLSFEFAVSKNQSNLTIGPFSGITKQGWDYGWLYSAKRAATGKPEPVGILVERVFPRKSFSGLGL